MAVFRIEKTRDYTVMSNHHLRNRGLSLKAKGLLSLMLSLPEEWDYLDEVIDATQTVYEQNNHTVSLSDPLKELEAQLNQIKMSVLLSKQAAKQAEEKKNEIVMYLAHDIRTPLTTVIGYLSLLHEAPDMPETAKRKK